MMGQFLTHLGPKKPKKLSHRFGRILLGPSRRALGVLFRGQAFDAGKRNLDAR
jgi:hypothetical protein